MNNFKPFNYRIDRALSASKSLNCASSQCADKALKMALICYKQNLREIRFESMSIVLYTYFDIEYCLILTLTLIFTAWTSGLFLIFFRKSALLIKHSCTCFKCY